jgi:hypothetical protein
MVIACSLWARGDVFAQKYRPAQAAPSSHSQQARGQADKAPAVSLPWNAIPAAVREEVRKVVEHPRISAHGKPEAFYGRPDLYQWMLDHPDRATVAWRRLGATCIDITDLGNDRFGASDGQGTDVTWETIYRGPDMRIWYAEASAKPRPLLRAVPVHAVIVLHHTDRMDAAGRTIIQHQAELYLHTDNKGAILITRLLGATAPRLAEQSVNQLQMFFSGLMGNLERYPQLEREMVSGE